MHTAYLLCLRPVQRRDQLVANMTERAYDAKSRALRVRLGRKTAVWPGTRVAIAATPTGKPVDINFPTAASIPPVSIMSNEPGRPGQNGMDSVKP